MDVRATAIPEVKLITPKRFGDHRGFFAEVYNRQALAAAAGLDVEFVQDNHAYSAEAGTLRGLHFQAPPFAQAKLVRVLRGAVVDVAVDLRHGSPTFGRHVMVELTAASGTQILVPRGFAHGLLTLTPDTELPLQGRRVLRAGARPRGALGRPRLGDPGHCRPSASCSRTRTAGSRS